MDVERDVKDEIKEDKWELKWWDLKVLCERDSR